MVWANSSSSVLLGGIGDVDLVGGFMLYGVAVVL